MTARPQIRVLFFDVFGTCLQQREPVANELWEAAQQALRSDVSAISDEVRGKAEKMSHALWDEFGAEWNKENEDFVRESIETHGTVDWRAVDKNRMELLPELLAKRGLVVLNEANTTSQNRVGEGSLWNHSQLEHLGRVWHRLFPWPDTCRGLHLLNTKFITATLSDTYTDLMKELVSLGNVPFQYVLTAETFQSYKPNPKVYLGAAAKMGVKPEECALVAAHLSDLKGAKACGFYAINVVRPLEEKAPELKAEHIPDMIIAEDENGFITLAERLGISM